MFTVSVISHLEGRFLVLILHVNGLSYFPFIVQVFGSDCTCLRSQLFPIQRAGYLVLTVHVYNLSYVPFRGQDFWFRLYMFTISVMSHLEGRIFGSDCTCLQSQLFPI